MRLPSHKFAFPQTPSLCLLKRFARPLSCRLGYATVRSGGRAKVLQKNLSQEPGLLVVTSTTNATSRGAMPRTPSFSIVITDSRQFFLLRLQEIKIFLVAILQLPSSFLPKPVLALTLRQRLYEMRYLNWDVLLFPQDGSDTRVPLQEFKTQCDVVQDESTSLISLPSFCMALYHFSLTVRELYVPFHTPRFPHHSRRPHIHSN